LHFISPFIDVHGVLLAAPRSYCATLGALCSMLASCGSRNRLVRSPALANGSWGVIVKRLPAPNA